MAKWNIDASHASAEFAAKHMMITTVRGGFKNVTGTIDFDPAHPELASVEAVIDATSMSSTGVEQRDNHLKSADFLEIEKYPTITFKSTKVEPSADGKEAKVTGDLTLHGVTRQETLNVEFLGQINSPFGDVRAGFAGTTKINREEYGLTYNMALEAGGWLVGKEVTISLEVEAILVPVATAV
jgi:polyisoprenoid-binding protein YceI